MVCHSLVHQYRSGVFFPVHESPLLLLFRQTSEPWERWVLRELSQAGVAPLLERPAEAAWCLLNAVVLALASAALWRGPTGLRTAASALHAGLLLGLCPALGLPTAAFVAASLAYGLHRRLDDVKVSMMRILGEWLVFTLSWAGIVAAVYFGPFAVHFHCLPKAPPDLHRYSPHFQLALQGPHREHLVRSSVPLTGGSLVTLRSLGAAQPCWLRGHKDRYPARYADGRASSQEGVVSCSPRKDPANWWRLRLRSGEEPGQGALVELEHVESGGRLNSHDVAAPETPTAQEVSLLRSSDEGAAVEPSTVFTVELESGEGPWRGVTSVVQLGQALAEGRWEGEAPDGRGLAWLRLSGEQLTEGLGEGAEVVLEPETVLHRWVVEEHHRPEGGDLKVHSLPPPQLSFFDKLSEMQSLSRRLAIENEP